MCNSINIPKMMLQDYEDGDVVEMKVKGKVAFDEDGAAFLDVRTLDGEAVEDFDDSANADMDSDDAITLFIGKLNKDKRKKA